MNASRSSWNGNYVFWEPQHPVKTPFSWSRSPMPLYPLSSERPNSNPKCLGQICRHSSGPNLSLEHSLNHGVCSALEGMEAAEWAFSRTFYGAFLCQENLPLLPLSSFLPEQDINYFNYLYLKADNQPVKESWLPSGVRWFFFFLLTKQRAEPPQQSEPYRWEKETF